MFGPYYESIAPFDYIIYFHFLHAYGDGSSEQESGIYVVCVGMASARSTHDVWQGCSYENGA